MSDVVIMTDSNSGLSPEEGKKYGIAVLPMSFIINGKIYYEGLDITHEDFFAKLDQGADVSTSQPSPGDVMDMWDSLLKRHDEIVYIVMSGGLSKSFETACMLAEDYEGKVQVVDSKRVSVPQLQLVMDGALLAQQGKSAAEIKAALDELAGNGGIYITVDTLKYLKKGGRITSAAAVLGTMLGIKPVLSVHGEKLDAYDKVRGMKAGRRSMIAAVVKEIEERLQTEFKQRRVCLQMAYSSLDVNLVKEWEQQIREAFPELALHAAMLPLSLCCHIGPGALGIGVSVCENNVW